MLATHNLFYRVEFSPHDEVSLFTLDQIHTLAMTCASSDCKEKEFILMTFHRQSGGIGAVYSLEF